MKILTVNAVNFGAFYGEQRFQVADRGLVMVLGENRDEPRMDSNGAGKSTIFDAIDWALFGEVPKGDHVDSVINDEMGKNCQVIVHLENDDGSTILVQRSRKYAGAVRGLQYWVGDKERTTLDDKETQAQLELLLGMDRDTFHAAVYYAQHDDFNLADATDSKAMEILTKVMALGPIDEWLEKTKASRAEAEVEIQKGLAQIARLDGESQGLQTVDFKAQIQQWEEQRAARLQQGQAQLGELTAYLVRAEQSLNDEPAAVAALDAMVRAPVLMPVVAVPPSYQQALAGEQANVQTFRREVGAIEDKLRALGGRREGPCGACGQPVTGDHLKREESALNGQRAVAYQSASLASERVTAISQSIKDSLAEQQAAAVQAQAASQAYNQRVSELRTQVAGFTQLRGYVSQTQQSIARSHQSLAAEATAQNPFLAKEQEVFQRQAQLAQAIADATAQLGLHQARAQYLDFWVQGFGAKGLKSYILDSRLQELTDAANQWVHILTGGTVWVRFETQTLGRSTGKLANKINLRVFHYNRDGSTTERNYKSWSGGEKKRVAWGVSFGLSRLFAKRAAKSYDTIVLDEVFKYVDRAGRGAVMEMLRVIKAEKSSVFVIEHDADFQEAFEHRVLVRKENRRSTIVEIANGRRVEESNSGSEGNTGEEKESEVGTAGPTAQPGGAPSSDGLRNDAGVSGRGRPARKPAKSRAAASHRG